MNPEAFEAIVKEFVQKEEELLGWKAKDYATTEDRLKNFRDVSVLTGLSMSQVCLVYLLKHIQSICNQITTGAVRWEWETDGKEGTKQKIADAVNYLHILAGILKEEQLNAVMIPSGKEIIGRPSPSLSLKDLEEEVEKLVSIHSGRAMGIPESGAAT